MTADPCAYAKCRHTFDDHAGGYHCFGADGQCTCRRYISLAAVKASAARTPLRKAAEK